jgi:lipopolysaccharide export system permease protein
VRLFRIIDRYVFMEAFGLFVIGFSGFLAFLLINKLFLEAENILDPTRPGLAIVKIVLLEAPYFTTLALPVAVLFATLMSMGRLAKDNELTAMFTNGISLYRLFLPFLLLSSFSVILSYVTNEYLLTKASAKQQQLYAAFPRAKNAANEEPDPFIVKLDKGDFIASTFFDKDQGNLGNMVYDDWSDNKGQQLIVAQNGQVEGDSLIAGTNARAPAMVYQPSGDGLYGNCIKEPTDRVSLGLDLKTQFTEMRTPQELTQTELVEQSKVKKERGENPAIDLTDFHLRFSGPFASLAFALVAMPLSLRAPRDERLLGLIFSFSLAMIYYVIYFMGKLMGYNEVLPPWIGAWLQNIVFAVVALAIFVFSRK